MSQIDWGFDDVAANDDVIDFANDDVIDFGIEEDFGGITLEEDGGIVMETEDFGGIVVEEEKVGDNFTIVCKKFKKYSVLLAVGIFVNLIEFLCEIKIIWLICRHGSH